MMRRLFSTILIFHLSISAAFGALGSATVWEIRTTGVSTNGGGFDVGNSNFATDLAATTATGVPVVTSASYTFVTADVGALLFVKAGTNWTPGWYPIASVAGGAATLTATIGSAQLYGGATILNTAAGCATTASPTGGTWGVDYSQQATAQISWTDAVIGATTTQFTSVGNPPTQAMVGNIVSWNSGTGWTVQRVEIVSVAASVATCSIALGTTASTGGTGALGGAIDGLNTLAGVMIASNKAFVESGTYTQTATPANLTATCSATYNVPYSQIVGYYQARGDIGIGINAANRPVIKLATNTGLTCLNMTGSGMMVMNITFDGSSLGTSSGLVMIGGAQNAQINCLAKNFTSYGLHSDESNISTIYCEVTGCSGNGALAQIGAGNELIAYNYIHDNTCVGISVNANTSSLVIGNIVTNNTGAGSHGIATGFSSGMIIKSNTIHGNGGHGLYVDHASTLSYPVIVQNNIFSSNGGYGFKALDAGLCDFFYLDGNAYYNNTSGAKSNLGDRGAVNPINGVAPYIDVFDVILSVNPFVASASNNYQLNTTAGGGAACRGMGVPRTWPGNSATVSSPSMGAVQFPAGASAFVN